MLRFLKNWTLPVAIVVGVGLYFIFALTPQLDAAGERLEPIIERLLPTTIFLTLFVTFSKVDFHNMRLRGWHGWLFLAQFLLVGIILCVIIHFDKVFATETTSPMVMNDWGVQKQLLEVVLICIIAPCASASPVVTGKLGGDVTQMTTFVLASSAVTSLLMSAVFPIIEPHAGATFTVAFVTILKRLASVLLLPLLLGAVVRHRIKPLYEWFIRTPDLGFYLWSISLAMTAGLTMRNIVHSHTASHLFDAIALLSLATAIAQLIIGRIIGRATGEHVCTGQGMFQKNTGLAIWIALVYLTPEASIGAGCYVLWQNIINSYELWQHRRSGAPSASK